MRALRVSLGVLCTLACAGIFAGRATATPFTIDSSQSSLSIVVGAYNTDEDPPVFVPLTTPQQPGSDTTSLGGTLNVGLGSGTIELLGASIEFANQADPMEPLPGGGLPGSAPANYGLIIDLQGLVSGPGAARDIVASISLGATPLVGDSFDSNGALLGLTAGSLDANLTGFTTVVTTVDISGNSGLNAGGPGTLDIAGGIATLTIPVHVEASVPVEVSPGFVLPLVAIFDGQIVATAAVPEPSSIVLACAGAVCLGLVLRLSRP